MRHKYLSSSHTTAKTEPPRVAISQTGAVALLEAPPPVVPSLSLSSASSLYPDLLIDEGDRAA
jgi:hypothetical protein